MRQQSGGYRPAVAWLIVVVGLIAGVLFTNTIASAAPRWSIQPSPSPPGPPNGQLLGVACASPTDCTAIGSNGSGLVGGEVTSEAARLQRWNGVGCASAVQCLARRARATPRDVVIIISGPQLLAEHWDGTSWTFATAPQSPYNSSLSLGAIACPAVSNCYAVGSIATVSGQTLAVNPAVEHWDGSTWSVVPSPNGPKNSLISELNAITCTSPTNCVATGDTIAGNLESGALQEHAQLERWNGTAWSTVAVPKPAGSKAEILDGVSCADATDCVAVGASASASETKPLALRETGTTWSLLTTSLPGGTSGAGFDGVSCTSATACIVVGSAFTGSADDTSEPDVEPIAERWNGTTFTVDAVPPAAGTDAAQLLGVACVTASDCSAVGNSLTTSSGDVVPLNEHWNGSAWSVPPVPSATPYSQLTGVACPSATECFATGDAAILEQWNGSSWSFSPFGEKSSQSQLSDVDCVNVDNCFAVGQFSATAGPQPLAERWNGSQWSITPTSLPAGATNAALFAVSCATASNCTAIGGAGNASGPLATLVEHWNGTTWSIVPSPGRPDAVLEELTDVSCGGASSCNALGVALENDDSLHTFGEHWNGTTWRMERIPSSPFAEEVSVTSLSCSRANTCFAVGSYEVVTGTRQLLLRPLLLRWDGTRWVQMAGPRLPGNPPVAEYNVVSCSAPNQCLAVGFEAGGITSSLLDARWDGTRWSLVNARRPLSFEPSGLACRSAYSCYAVGSVFGSTGSRARVAHWGGAAWTDASVQNPAGSSLVNLFGVDCPSRTSCEAAGSSSTALGSFTLVLRGT